MILFPSRRSIFPTREPGEPLSYSNPVDQSYGKNYSLWSGTFCYLPRDSVSPHICQSHVRFMAVSSKGTHRLKQFLLFDKNDQIQIKIWFSRSSSTPRMSLNISVAMPWFIITFSFTTTLALHGRSMNKGQY